MPLQTYIVEIMMPQQSSALRTASSFLIGFGILIIVLSVAAGLLNLLTALALGFSALVTSLLVLVGGIASGLLMYTFGHIARSIDRIESYTRLMAGQERPVLSSKPAPPAPVARLG